MAMGTLMSTVEKFQKIANTIADDRETDTLVYVGGINTASAREVANTINSRDRRQNIFFVLGTNGGDPHAAYKIARSIQHAYEKGKITIGIYGDCKSAGTLVALSAHSVVMCEHGELGPLDVQIRKDDQLFVRGSGLTTSQALESLRGQAFDHFEHFLLEIHDRTGYDISMKLATSMAIRLTVGLLGPIYSQINPMQIGETQRAMDVGRAYGERLDVKKNLKDDALDKLLEQYPSHDFSIDFDEAKTLFHRISRPDELERELGQELAFLLLNYQTVSARKALILYLNEPKPEIKKDEEHAAQHGNNSGASTSDAAGESAPPGNEGAGGEGAKPSGKPGPTATVETARVSARSASSNGGK